MNNLKLKHLFVLILIVTTNLIFGQSNLNFEDIYHCSGSKDSLNGLPVFEVVEKMPSFPGGEEARVKFLIDKIEYVMDTSGVLQTSVYSTFVIDTAGKVTNICIPRPFFKNRYSEIEKRTVKILASMPQWIPGEQAGRKVPVRFTMPIKFEPTY